MSQINHGTIWGGVAETDGCLLDLQCKEDFFHFSLNKISGGKYAKRMSKGLWRWNC